MPLNISKELAVTVYVNMLKSELVKNITDTDKINTYRKSFSVFERYARYVHQGVNYSTERRKQIMIEFSKEIFKNAPLYYTQNDEFDDRYTDLWIECCCKHYYLHHVGGTGEQFKLTEFFLGERIEPVYSK